MNFRFNIEYQTQWGEDLRIRIAKIDKKGQKKSQSS